MGVKIKLPVSSVCLLYSCGNTHYVLHPMRSVPSGSSKIAPHCVPQMQHLQPEILGMGQGCTAHGPCLLVPAQGCYNSPRPPIAWGPWTSPRSLQPMVLGPAQGCYSPWSLDQPKFATAQGRYNSPGSLVQPKVATAHGTWTSPSSLQPMVLGPAQGRYSPRYLDQPKVATAQGTWTSPSLLQPKVLGPAQGCYNSPTQGSWYSLAV